MAREGSETAAQGEGSLWQDKPVQGRHHHGTSASRALLRNLRGGVGVVVDKRQISVGSGDIYVDRLIFCGRDDELGSAVQPASSKSKL